MKLKCLGSGSSGNCYLLENDTECLVIEAGLPFMEVKKALDFNIRKIIGVVVSHSHKDHSKYINEYKSICPILKPYEVFYASEHLGSFYINFFELVHDVPCYGFYIKHPEIGTFVYASDTEYIKYRFRNVNHFLIECNYSKNLIEHDAVNRNHVLSGHMELQTCKEFLKVNNSTRIRNVVLCHLSHSNSDEKLFREEISKVVDCDVKIANKGLCVELMKEPF